MAILGKQRAREYETVWRTLNTMQDIFAADPEGKGVKGSIDVFSDFFVYFLKMVDRGTPSVMYNLGFEPELIYALDDVLNIPVPLAGALCSIAGDQNDTEAFIDTAEAGGYSSECCSADKISMGAMIKGLYPEPTCLVGINTPCDSQVSVVNAMSERNRDKPLFIIDVPPYEDEETFKHVAAQLKQLVSFLEEHTKRTLDIDRLREVCETTNRTSEYLWQWMDWRSKPPTMQPSKTCAFTMMLMIGLAGSEFGERLAKCLAEDAKEKVEKGSKYFDEKVRAIWYQDPVWWDIQIYDWMERELGLVIPMDVFGYYGAEAYIDTKDMDSMLYGLARKMIMCHPMSRQFRGSIKRYVDDFMTMHDKFQTDCGIFAGHVACKHSWGGVGLFKEACRKAGIPLLVFEFDMFDSRILTYRELQFELQRFINDVVLPRKERMAAGA